MSSIIHKIDQAINPDRREYGTGPGTAQTAGSAANVPRGATHTTHAGATNAGYADPAYASTDNYTTGGAGFNNQVNPAGQYGRNLPGPAPNTAGPHRSDILNKLDPRVDSDLSNPQTRAAHAAAMGNLPGPAPNTAGPHRSDLLNKLDPTVDSDLSTGKGAGTGGFRTGGGGFGPGGASAYNTTSTTHHQTSATGVTGSNIPEGTYGPHRSRLANALDPRVDSDMDRTHHGAAPMGQAQVHPGYPAASGALGTNAPGGTHPPHQSHLANVLDPRVDSNMDGHRQGMPQTGHGAPPFAAGGAALGANVPEGTYGPHNSRMANALDPRVDSDFDSRRHAGSAQAAYGQPGFATGGGAGVNVPEGSYGPHNSRLANTLDPRVDSDMDRGERGTGFAGGHAPAQPMTTTAPGQTLGPHKSSLLNKLDPKVDSKTGQIKPPKHI